MRLFMDRRTFLRTVAAVPLVAAGMPQVTASVQRASMLGYVWMQEDGTVQFLAKPFKYAVPVRPMPIDHPLVIAAQREYNRLRSLEAEQVSFVGEQLQRSVEKAYPPGRPASAVDID